MAGLEWKSSGILSSPDFHETHLPIYLGESWEEALCKIRQSSEVTVLSLAGHFGTILRWLLRAEGPSWLAEHWSNSLMPRDGLSKWAEQDFAASRGFPGCVLAGCVSFRLNHRSTAAGIFKQIAFQQTGKCHSCHFLWDWWKLTENRRIVVTFSQVFCVYFNWCHYCINALSTLFPPTWISCCNPSFIICGELVRGHRTDTKILRCSSLL